MHLLPHRFSIFHPPKPLLPPAPCLRRIHQLPTIASSPFPARRLSACASTLERGVPASNVAAASSPYKEEEISATELGYRIPPKEIRDIVNAPPLPVLSLSPLRDYILFLQRGTLPPLEELARPEEKLAGLRIDCGSNCRSRLSYYTGIVIHRLMEDGKLGPEKEVHGFPDGAKINFVSWSLDGRHLSFSIRVDEGDNDGSKLKVWVADVETGRARPLFRSPDIYLNAVFDNYVWLNDSTLVVCTIPELRGDYPKKPLVPTGPKIQSNEQWNAVRVDTFEDLLKDKYDEELFDYYATSQLILVSLDGEMKPIGPPAVYTAIDRSPDQKFLLVSSIHRPYSYIVPYGRFPKKVELWTAHGEFVRELCDLPLAEDIPIGYNSVRIGKRSINWRSDKPSTLYWVETQDGGDANLEVSPRDIIYTEPAVSLDDLQPEILHRLDLRYGGIFWCDDSLALVYESWYKTRQTRTWAISPGFLDMSPRIASNGSFENVSPMMWRTAAGTYVLARIKKGDLGSYILLNGSSATPEGNVPFLDLFDLNTGGRVRIWKSDTEKYYETVLALMSNQSGGELPIDHLKILTSKESKTENTQYCLQVWPGKGTFQITQFPHPYPQLSSLQKEMLRYRRKDGVLLTATLYLPPNHDPEKDGPPPCLVWLYPGEFKNKDAAGHVHGSPNEFAAIESTSPLLWLARGFSVLYGPTIRIIGEDDEEANDRYIKELVGSITAAVDEVIWRRVAHPDRIAVIGHGHGAFITASLLAHAPHLFCCGIALSGVYNRTLTPFGFQNENRSLWEATNTYVEMSPFMSANKIKKPILLIHGEEDGNSGALTMQSDRFFTALKGHGAPCRLVILPFESHDYAARESIMHVLWEVDRWLESYCINNSSTSNNPRDSKTEEKSQNDGENIPATAKS